MSDIEKRRQAVDLFADYSQAFRLNIMKPIEKRLRTETPPAGFMAMLFIYSNGPCTMSELTHALCCSKQQTTQTVDKLIKSNYAIRQTHESDRRKIVISITEEGKMVVKRAMGEFKNIFSDALDVLSNDELDELITALEVMKRIFEKVPAPQV